ncbi:MAG: lipoate--protein ligase [Clostridia bacterium]|nr:lipoate--protein ligase [Clostridia bacterium]
MLRNTPRHPLYIFMKYVRLTTTDPYYNLAVEEYLFRSADTDIFMLWQNAPSVIAGRNQNVYAEADLAYAKENGIRICRRITGGGAVYHDLGNLNYTFISVGKEARPLDFAHFARPIRECLESLGLHTHMSDRNDIECEGGKFSGNAQHAEGGRILHHGTLLFDTDFSVMERVLRVDKEKLAYRAVKSLRARVVNLRSVLPRALSVEEFIAGIEDGVCSLLSAERCAPPENKEIDALYERNRSPEWIYSDKRYLTGYRVSRKKKYPFGLVSVEMELSRDKIERIQFSGDFFSTAPIEKLENALIGKTLDALGGIDPSPYIHGMKSEELCALLSDHDL